MLFKHYDFIKSNAIDYMHGVHLGVSKLFINLWIGSSHSKERFSINNAVCIINQRLLKMQQPAFITRYKNNIRSLQVLESFRNESLAILLFIANTGRFASFRLSDALCLFYLCVQTV